MTFYFELHRKRSLICFQNHDEYDALNFELDGGPMGLKKSPM